MMVMVMVMAMTIRGMGMGMGRSYWTTRLMAIDYFFRHRGSSLAETMDSTYYHE